MNVLYVDIDGVLNSYSNTDAIVERMVSVLADICHTYDCKVCIESTHKPIKDEFGEESQIIIELERMLKKYNIELIGYTPQIEIHEGSATIGCWKDFEIIYHLMRHPQIEHFAIIDDNDYVDLVLLRDYLVETCSYNLEQPELEGLTESHKEQVGQILKKENIYKSILKRK